MLAALGGHEEVCRLLVRHGADRNAVANDGTSLAQAVLHIRNAPSET